MGHNVLRAWHQMIGCDFHDLWVPGTPSATGVAPYFVMFPALTGLTFLTAKYGTSVEDQYSWTMQRGTDIGPMIPHIGPPNLFWPVMLGLSGSKSHFGTTQVTVEGKSAAVALVWIVNINLNCCGPVKRPPLPSGMVITHNTVEAAFTLGDFMAGLAHMAADMALEWGLNLIFAGLGKLGPVQRLCERAYERGLYRGIDWLIGSGGLVGMLERTFPRASGPILNRLFQAHLAEALLKGVGAQFPVILGSILTGSPLGYAPDPSPAASGEGTTGLGDFMDSGHDAVRDYFNQTGDENIGDFPLPSGDTALA